MLDAQGKRVCISQPLLHAEAKPLQRIRSGNSHRASIGKERNPSNTSILARWSRDWAVKKLFMCFSAHSLVEKRRKHIKQNPKKIPGQPPGNFCLCVLLSLVFFATHSRGGPEGTAAITCATGKQSVSQQNRLTNSDVERHPNATN